MNALAINQNTLIICIGNNGRQDDGLGWAFGDALHAAQPNIEIVYRYQLNIEDADLISNRSRVVFVDADKRELDGGVLLEPVVPVSWGAATSHSLTPSNVLQLSQELYNANPEAFNLSIQGYSWELEQGLTSKAQQNLAKALAGIRVISGVH